MGRRPEGLRQAGGELRASLGAFFAGSAALEAASVPAFLRLARELSCHGAPRSLAARAVTAAEDEVQHARAVGQLARSFGGTLAPGRGYPGVMPVPLHEGEGTQSRWTTRRALRVLHWYAQRR